MSNDQQPNEKKGPTNWHVIGVGSLMGVFFIVFVFFMLGVKGWPLEGLLSMLFVSLLFSIFTSIGAAIGVNAQKGISKRWKGYWIGAVLGAVIGCCLLNGIYVYLLPFILNL